MWHIPKIDDYLKILTDEEVKDSVSINFNEYFKSIREEKDLEFEYLKELRELHNDYPLAPDIIEIKKAMLSEYQLKIPDWNIPTGNIQKSVPNFFDK